MIIIVTNKKKKKKKCYGAGVFRIWVALDFGFLFSFWGRGGGGGGGIILEGFLFVWEGKKKFLFLFFLILWVG